MGEHLHNTGGLGKKVHMTGVYLKLRRSPVATSICDMHYAEESCKPLLVEAAWLSLRQMRPGCIYHKEALSQSSPPHVHCQPKRPHLQTLSHCQNQLQARTIWPIGNCVWKKDSKNLAKIVLIGELPLIRHISVSFPLPVPNAMRTPR